MKQTSYGFTAVELLITMIIGSLLLVTAYQLYTFVLNDSADTRIRASASNLAYRLMREATASATRPCTASTTSPAIPAEYELPPGSSASVKITCPSLGVSVPYINATVTYGTGKTVSHATYTSVD